MKEEIETPIELENVFPPDPEPSIDEQIEQLPEPMRECLKVARRMFFESVSTPMPWRRTKIQQRVFHLKIEDVPAHRSLDTLLAAGWNIMQPIPSLVTTDVLFILSREEPTNETGEGKP